MLKAVHPQEVLVTVETVTFLSASSMISPKKWVLDWNGAPVGTVNFLSLATRPHKKKKKNHLRRPTSFGLSVFIGIHCVHSYSEVVMFVVSTRAPNLF